MYICTYTLYEYIVLKSYVNSYIPRYVHHDMCLQAYIHIYIYIYVYIYIYIFKYSDTSQHMSPWLAATRPAPRINAREEHKQYQDRHGHGEKAS